MPTRRNRTRDNRTRDNRTFTEKKEACMRGILDYRKQPGKTREDAAKICAWSIKTKGRSGGGADVSTPQARRYNRQNRRRARAQAAAQRRRAAAAFDVNLGSSFSSGPSFGGGGGF